MGASKRAALRYVIYIHSLGGSPLPYTQGSYRGYAIALQHQYDDLRKRCSPEHAAAARVAGRNLIRLHTLSLAAEHILPGSSPADRRAICESAVALNCPTLTQQAADTSIEERAPSPRETRRAECMCRRKLCHVDYWSALLHLRRLGREGIMIYPCGICDGLHIGHDQEHSRKRRLAKRELSRLEERLRVLEEERVKLQDRKKLLLEIIW